MRRTSPQLWLVMPLVAAIMTSPAMGQSTVHEVQFEVRFKESAEPQVELHLVAKHPRLETQQWLVPLDDKGLGHITFKGEDTEGAWRLSCAAETQWCSASTELRPMTTVALAVYPAGRLEGKFPAKPQLPEHVQIQGWTALESLAELSFSNQEAIEDAKFNVKVPAVPLDLRLALGDWAPIYLWEVTPKAGQTFKTGTLQLHAGASLCAFVVDGVSGRPVSGAQVLLQTPPPEPGTSGQEFTRLNRMRWTATTNERGFFQIHGATAGSFQLHINPATLLDSEAASRPLKLESVELTAEAETCLDDLELPLGAEVLFTMIPVLGPEDEPWRLTLFESTSSRTQPIRGVFDLGGQLRLDVLPGDYTLQVSNSLGQRLLRRQATIEEATEIPLELDLAKLDGTVHLAGEPLLASIQLIGHEIDSTFESDSEGRFGGWIRTPQDGAMVARIRSAYPAFSRWLEIEDAQVDEGVVNLVLDLEDHSLAGIVVDSEGKPLRRVRVVAADESGMSVAALSEVDGRFQLQGLGSGRHRVWGTLRDYGSSSTHHIEVDDATSLDSLRLVVSPGEHLNGSITNQDGAPVPGARLTISFPGHSGWLDSISSGADGRFAVRAPSGAQRALVTVSAPAVGQLGSTCAEISESGLQVTFTNGPGGNVVIEPPEDAQSFGSQPVLLNSDGGVLTGSDLGGWATRHGGGFSDGVLTVPGLAPGFYSLARVRGNGRHLGCHQGTPTSPWQQLAPGGELRLEETN